MDRIDAGFGDVLDRAGQLGAGGSVTPTASNWSPASWRTKTALHIPADYPDMSKLDAVEKQLSSYPPLVFAGEARTLMSRLADVATARLSCCRAAIAPRASRSSIRTISATRSALILQMASC
jgi:3-deoxy-D-arabino-heptulosonate 7-phosphate (DAHP) synthase class II